MTKEEYLALKDVPIRKWSYEQCLAADRLIKDETLKAAEANLLTLMPTAPKFIHEYMSMMLDLHYGSIETDECLMTLKTYPTWMY